jgi:hypothetical protein
VRLSLKAAAVLFALYVLFVLYAAIEIVSRLASHDASL